MEEYRILDSLSSIKENFLLVARYFDSVSSIEHRFRNKGRRTKAAEHA
jgi:hypothetical protein